MTLLASSRVSVFLATAKADEARVFYRDTLGLTMTEDNPYGLVFDLEGAELRLSKVAGFTPFPWTVLDWHVQDIAATMKALAAKGVEFTRFDGIDHDADGIWTTPDGKARIAWFRDPDDNVLSVSQRS
ncbi:VOC family protein [Parvularcula sp. IMCC14364]|uniref:VOC family protein n=1 Tax=Parvularcula sp. IMCC14364 TaxID=3067902 RepID=UPI002740F396|nr:hypothetical protein [Parvularcula sp. IMCC14364]